MTEAPDTGHAEAWDWLRSSSGEGLVPGLPSLRWHPSRLEACVEARERTPVAPLDDAELKELRRAHRRWGADGSSLEALELLGDPATRVVVTGQQPGMLAGPLLTVYKTLGAILLSKRLAGRHPGKRFVPVFWSAGEDHDFDEVKRAVWPDRSGALTAWSAPPEVTEPGRMVGEIRAGEHLQALVSSIEAGTYDTDFRAGVLTALIEAYGGESGLEDGFCRLLLSLLPGMGLVIVSSRMEWLRRRAVPLLRRELLSGGATSRAVNERGDRLAEAGLARAFRRPEGSLNCFWIDERKRRWTLRDEGEGSIVARPAGGDSGERRLFTKEELTQLAIESPDRFSFNVVTRPMAQDAALATVAQVVGPGEAAYLTQVEGVYDDFGVFAPVRWPRPQAVLIEPRVERRLERLGVAAEAACGMDGDALLDAALLGTDASEPLRRVGAMRARQHEELAQLQADLPNDQAISGAIGKLAQAMEKGYDKLSERLSESARRGQEVAGESARAVAASLRPEGQPQERVLNPLVPFAINYGMDWPVRLAGGLLIEPGVGMQVLRPCGPDSDSTQVRKTDT